VSGLVVDGLRAHGRDGFAIGPLSFAVAPGEALAVVGPAGAGKTLLLKALAGLVPCSGVRERPSPVAMQFPRDALVDDETVLENVRACCTARSVADPDGAARAALTAVGLGARLAAAPRTLSGGQRRRAGLARALAVQPGLLLLDDPTAGLDPKTASEVAQLFLGDPRRVVVFSTEDVDALVPRASAVLVLPAPGSASPRAPFVGPPAALAGDAELAAFAPRAGLRELPW
jgi:ABC-type multidrug transport system ATPase subunit